MSVCALLFAASCASDKPPPGAQNEWCLSESPMRLATDEVADYIFSHDPRLAERITAYNLRGERECGWSF